MRHTSAFSKDSPTCRTCVIPMCVTALAFALWPSFAMAQTSAGVGDELQIEEIIVTAMRREQQLQDVPIAISAFSESMIYDIGGTNFTDIAALVPGMEYQQNNEGSARITMRGVSSLQGNATVSVYIDEIPITSPFDQPDLMTFDVNRIEVLRGPQGTLYGEASMGGVIRVITNQPDPNEFAAKVEMQGTGTDGGGGGIKAQAVINLPLVENRLGLRVYGNFQEQDGWIDGVNLGKNINGVDKVGGRVAARYLGGEKFTATVNVLYQKSESESSSQSDEDYNTTARLLSPSDDEYSLTNLTMDYEFPWATLISSTGLYERETESKLDISDIGPGLNFLFNLGCPFGFPPCEFPDGIDTVAFNLDFEEETFTQEFRLVSSSEQRLRWTLGAWYKDASIDQIVRGITDPRALSGFDSLLVDEVSDVTQRAIYGQIDFDFTDRFHAAFGMRYFEEDRDSVAVISGLPTLFIGGPSAIVDSANDKVWTPRFSLSFDVSDDATIYASAARGFRGGGINVTATAINLINMAFGVPVPPAPDIFDPDTLWSYELGWKTAWANRRVVFEGAVFFVDWDNVQVAGESGAAPLGFTINGGNAESKGAEVSLMALLTDNLELTVASSYTKAETTQDNPGAPAGAKLPQVPQFKHAVALQYRRPITASLGWMLRGTWTFLDERNESLAGTTVFPSYNQIDARIGIEGRQWQAYLFGANLSNEAGQITDGSSFGEGYYIRPRTIGISMRVQF